MVNQPLPGLETAASGADARPLVSAITIFLDAGRFLAEAIESVFSQTYGNWELLLVDDGSTDGSTEIARRYAERYPQKVRYLEHEGHENRGLSPARNLGIRHARGEYIALLDADDVWLPQKLERQVAILRRYPEVAMVYDATEWWHSWTGSPEDAEKDFVHDLGVPLDTVIRPPALVAPFFFRQDAAIPCTCSILVRREAADAVGGFEDSFRGAYGVYDDQAFYAKLVLSAPLLAAGDVSSRYRQHPGSATYAARDNGREYAARLYFLRWLAGYMTDRRVDGVEIWRGLGKEIWRCRHPRLAALLQSGQLRLRWTMNVAKLAVRRGLSGAMHRWKRKQRV